MQVRQFTLALAALGLAVTIGCGSGDGAQSGGPSLFGGFRSAPSPTPAGAAPVSPSAGTIQPEASATPRPSTNGGKPLTGAWAGKLRCDTGEDLPATYKVAPSGNPVYEYTTKSGPRTQELTKVGQTIQFVPPEGGVTTIVVEELVVAAERIRYTLRLSEERTSGGFLTQGKATSATDAVLKGGKLDTQVVIRAQETLSRPGAVIPGDTQTATCRGPLARA
jgi:hypothetical protein